MTTQIIPNGMALSNVDRDSVEGIQLKDGEEMGKSNAQGGNNAIYGDGNGRTQLEEPRS